MYKNWCPNCSDEVIKDGASSYRCVGCGTSIPKSALKLKTSGHRPVSRKMIAKGLEANSTPKKIPTNMSEYIQL